MKPRPRPLPSLEHGDHVSTLRSAKERLDPWRERNELPTLGVTDASELHALAVTEADAPLGIATELGDMTARSLGSTLPRTSRGVRSSGSPYRPRRSDS